MGRIEKAEQQRDRDGLHILGADIGDQRVDLAGRQGRDDGAIGTDPPGDLETAAAGNEGGGRILEEVVEVGARGAAQLQHVAKAAGAHEGGAGALVLEQRVGDDGGRMGQQRNVARLDSVSPHGHLECRQDALGEIAGCCRCLGHADAPRPLVDQRHVREGAADIDADAPAHAVMPPTRSSCDLSSSGEL